MNTRCRLSSLSQFFKLSADQPRRETHQGYLASTTFYRCRLPTMATDRTETKLRKEVGEIYYSLSNNQQRLKTLNCFVAMGLSADAEDSITPFSVMVTCERSTKNICVGSQQQPRENNSYLVSCSFKENNEGFTWMNKRCRLSSLSQFFKLSTGQPRRETHQDYLASRTFCRCRLPAMAADRTETKLRKEVGEIYYSLSNNQQRLKTLNCFVAMGLSADVEDSITPFSVMVTVIFNNNSVRSINSRKVIPLTFRLFHRK